MEAPPRRLNPGRAVGLWIAYAVVFAVAGGLGAGVPAFLFETVTTEPYDDTLYAITFGVTGYIGYKLALQATG